VIRLFIQIGPRYYGSIVDRDYFNLDKDAFDNCGNDLVVSITSQLGGLPKQIRQPDSNDIPNHSAIYCNTIHEWFYIKGDDGIFSETNSPHIQNDVIRLLSFSDNSKFADAIGIDSSNCSSKWPFLWLIVLSLLHYRTLI
jgi:hypothetical protein